MHSNETSIGPISTTDLSQLKSFFEQNQIAFEVEIDETLKAEADILMEKHGNGDYDYVSRRAGNRFDYYQAKFLYVYIKNEDAPKVKDLLFSLGLSEDAESIPEQIPSRVENQTDQDEEFFCINCDYRSNYQGTCPKHGVRLLEYFEWLEAKREKAANSNSAKISRFLVKIIAYALMIGIVGGGLLALYKSLE